MSETLKSIIAKKPEERTEEENKELQAHIDAYRTKVRDTDLEFGLTHASILAIGENGVVPAFKIVVIPDEVPKTEVVA